MDGLALKEILEIWKEFDEGYKRSNDAMLIKRILDLLSRYEVVPGPDLEMYEELLRLINNGGFLIKEEKQFLINYSLLILSEVESPTIESLTLRQLRDCSSILDVWPDKQGVRDDYASSAYRKEAVVWLIRKYEALGNHFLHKRAHARTYSDMELALELEKEKCKLREAEYPVLERFFKSTTSYLKDKDHTLCDLEGGLKIMRKLIWKIKEGITKY